MALRTFDKVQAGHSLFFLLHRHLALAGVRALEGLSQVHALYKVPVNLSLFVHVWVLQLRQALEVCIFLQQIVSFRTNRILFTVHDRVEVPRKGDRFTKTPASRIKLVLCTPLFQQGRHTSRPPCCSLRSTRRETYERVSRLQFVCFAPSHRAYSEWQQ